MHITYLQVEASTKCNAWCPGCGRNNDGFGIVDHLKIEDLDSVRYKQILEELSGLEIIEFCGTYGDAIAAKNIKELVEISKLHCKKIIIRTNGSLRTTEWWRELGASLSEFDHEIWFCLDGLKDTHSIYRQGTDFDSIISNAQAFMSSGGVAVWQFIPWKHNEHQIKECIKLSQQLGFKRFEFIKDVRTDFTARQYQTGNIIEIHPWSENSKFSKYEKKQKTLTKEHCRHLTQPSLYLNANGKISNCCFFNLQICADKTDQLPDIAQELSNPREICLKYCSK